MMTGTNVGLSGRSRAGAGEGGVKRDYLPVDAGGDARACAAGSPHVGAMPGAAVSVPVWRFQSQMPKVLEKFRFGAGISKMA